MIDRLGSVLMLLARIIASGENKEIIMRKNFQESMKII